MVDRPDRRLGVGSVASVFYGYIALAKDSEIFGKVAIRLPTRAG